MTEDEVGPILLKLGGSLITDKRTHEHARLDVLDRLAAELAGSSEAWTERGLIVGHGSGSFGHQAAAGTPLASRRGEATPGGALRSAVAVTQDAAARLHRIVVRSLLRAGLDAYSLAPSGWLTLTGAGGVASLHLDPIVGALRVGLMPVVYGDVVVDQEAGAAIASTEEVFHVLARSLGERGSRPSRAVWLGETDGILDRDGKVVPEVTRSNLDAVRASTGGSAGVDVTGGMRLRLETAWRMALDGVPSWIGDGRRRGIVAAALGGETMGGTVVTCEE